MPNSKHSPKAAQSSVAGDTIQHKRSDVPGLVPDSSELSYGELAINIKDMRLFTKDAEGYVHEIGDGVEVYGPSNLPPLTGVEKGDIWLSTDPSLFSPTFDPSTIHPIPGPTGPKGEPGMSAYADYVQRTGSSLTFDEFMDTLTGPPGAEGPKGDPGETLKVDGFVPTAASLPISPPVLTVYVTQDTGRLWVYDPLSTAANTDGWVDMGKIQGPPGNDVRFLASVATAADLPATAQAGDICFTTVDGDLHAWNDNAVKWDLVGRLRGDGVVPGTADNQILVWSASNSRWEPTAQTSPTSIADLTDFDDVNRDIRENSVMVWDEVAQSWTDSRSIDIDEIEFGANAPGTLLEGIAAYSDAGLDPTKDTWVPSCLAVDKYIKEVINLEDLGDCKELSTATNGQVPVWNNTTSQWEPQDQSGNGLNDLGDVVIAVPAAGELLTYDDQTGAWKNSPPYQNYVNLKVEQFAMGLASTLPLVSKRDDPPGWVEASNKYYLVGENPTGDWAGHANQIAFYVIRSGGGYSWHFHWPVVNEEHFIESENAEYRWTGTAWEVAHDAGLATTQYVDQKHAETTTTLASYATQSYVDTLIGQITTGLAHKVAVEAISNTPPTGPVAVGDHYIVGTAPTGEWAGHANKVAVWGVGATPAWTFEAPHVNDSHFVESVRKTYTWNGSLWVVVSESTTANNPGELWMVGDIKQSILTETQFINQLPEAERFKWCLADGRNVTGSAWAATTGQNTVPDLRGAYLRMAGRNGNASWDGGTLNAYSEDSTALPQTAFAGTTNTTGNHRHKLDRMAGDFAGEWASTNLASANGNKNWPYTDYQGNHSHTVTINGGGDEETKPKTYSVNYYVKIN